MFNSSSVDGLTCSHNNTKGLVRLMCDLLKYMLIPNCQLMPKSSCCCFSLWQREENNSVGYIFKIKIHTKTICVWYLYY